LRRGLSVRYLLPNRVVDYIEQHGLYLDEGAGTAITASDKGKDREASPSLSKKEGTSKAC